MEQCHKKICKLEDSLKKNKKSNSSQRRTINADQEIINKMYVIKINNVYLLLIQEAYNKTSYPYSYNTGIHLFCCFPIKLVVHTHPKHTKFINPTYKSDLNLY